MVYIYTLQLEKGKYYIGKTNYPDFRIEEHLQSTGSTWTTIFKPIKVIELISNCDDYDEDKITIKYMNKYGINNVRGGSFVSMRLDSMVINTLKQMLNGTNDNCFMCGQKGHFSDKCPTGVKDSADHKIQLFNKKYTSSIIETFDFDVLNHKIIEELHQKVDFSIDEYITQHIYDHKNIGRNIRDNKYYLRQYTNGYLTNYGNIIMCKSNFGNYPNVDNFSKGIILNRKLSVLEERRFAKENWKELNHYSKLKDRIIDISSECKMWEDIITCDL